ncbi:MAG: hypothetical protein IH588_01460 [Anaerolineales bacterium]|nr:hypothetical protein [Anaerolineales bacterium]
MLQNDEPIQVTLLVTDVLEHIGVKYVIGDSLASALHGVARATMDAGIVANIQEEHVTPFVHALKEAFYVDDQMIRDAIQHQMSFNLIHLQTLFKIDIFVAKDRDFDHLQIERRTAYPLSSGSQQSIYIASALPSAGL